MIFRRGKSKRSRRRELEAELGELMMEVWDPRGLHELGHPSRSREYDKYVGLLLELLDRGRPAEQIGFYLKGIRTEQMGLDPDVTADNAASERIFEWFHSRPPPA
jgi:hypothetical protein